jgi:uncharacterized membrane protein YciS (DUF1049 family)
MTGEVIKSFLVGLGFGVDESSLAKFNKSIASASLRVTALYATIKVAAAGIFWGISKIAEGFEQMGYEYRIIAPMISKALMLRQALLSAYKAAGINIVKVVQQSVLFNFSLAKTKFALEAIYKSVGAKFLPLLTKQMDIFRTKIYANMPKIQAALERFVNFIFKAFEATSILGARVWSILERVYGFFQQLDAATNGWSTIVFGLIAAWKLLNLAFLTTPLGMILTGLTALLALYDDFKTFQEGGESFFDWSSALPAINTIKSALGGLADVWRSIVDVVLDLVLAVQSLFSQGVDAFFDSIKQAGRDALGVLLDVGKASIKIKDAFSAVGSFISGAFGGATSGPALPGGAQPAPLMPAGGNTHQRVSQETHISVQGSADANATGKAVASEQSRVNFDLTRNLRGATR